MARRFASVPNVGAGNDKEVLRALVDVMGYITAQTQDKITPLASTATLADVITKVNQIIARLQGTT